MSLAPAHPQSSATAADGLWVSVSELAKLRRRDKATTSRRIARLEADGLLTTSKGPRGTKLINLAAFDRATGGVGGSLAEKSPGTAAETAAHEHARREAYRADIARLDLAERLGALLPTDDVVLAAAQCAGAFLAALVRLPSHADQIAAAVGRDGPQGARAYLDALAIDIQRAAEGTLTDLAAAGSGTASAGTCLGRAPR